MTNTLEPIFAHYIDDKEEASAVFQFQLPMTTDQDILIGTNRGSCLLFSTVKLKQLSILHQDNEMRQIVAIGEWPISVGEEQDKSTRNAEREEKPELISKHVKMIWLHFRCSSIAIFKLIYNSVEVGLEFLRDFRTGHYGFCRAMTDLAGGRIFIPDHEDSNSALRIRFRNGAEKLIIFGEEFMNRLLRKARGKDAQNGMFKGLLMGVEDVGGDQILLAFEDSTVCVFDLQAKLVLDALKHPKHPEFLCWSVAKTAGEQQTLVAVSVVGQVYLLSHSTSSELPLKCECKIAKNAKDTCTAVAISPFSAGLSQMIALGFKYGGIEIHSLQIPTAENPHWTACISSNCAGFHVDAIHCLQWVSGSSDGGSDAKQRRECAPMPHSRSSALLCCGAADGKVSFFEVPSTCTKAA